MGALLVGLEMLTNLIDRCTIYENLYIGRTGKAFSNFEAALIRLCAGMLRFLANAGKLYGRSAGRRIVGAVLQPDRITNLASEFEKLQIQVEYAASNCERTTSRAAQDELEQLLADLKAPIVRTDVRLTTLWDRSDQSRRIKILRWLSDIPYKDMHDEARKGHVKDTGEWLLKHEKYLEWRRSSASMVLWLHGIRESCPLNWRFLLILTRFFQPELESQS